MKAGELRDRITLYHCTENLTESGDDLQTWTSYATVWADVNTASSSEKELAAGKENQNVYTVLIRYKTELLPSDKIVFGDLTLNIGSIVDDGMNRQQVLTCVARIE